MKDKKRLFLLLGPICFIASAFFLPQGGLDFKAAIAVGTFMWMAVWWIGQPVEPAVAALLPILTNALFGILDMEVILASYLSETAIMILGASIVSQTWTKTGLDKRIALKVLSLIGTSVRHQVTAWFIIALVLSTVAPNLLVGVMLLPIAFVMLEHSGEIHTIADVPKSVSACIILSAVTWGTYVGGMGSPMGGAMNMITVDYFQQLTGHEFMYHNWTLRILPLMLSITAVSILVLRFVSPKDKHLWGSQSFFKKAYEELPALSRIELISGFLFFGPIVLVFARPLYAVILPELKSGYVFLAAAFLSFFIKDGKGKPLMLWREMEKQFSWNLLFLVGSGLAIGNMLTQTNTITLMAGFITASGLKGGLFTLLVICVFAMFVAEISNNIVSASLTIPIIIGILQKLDINPIPYIYVSIAAYNCAFMMPTSVRAMPIGYGVEPKFIMKYGSLLSFSVLCTILFVGYLLIQFFPSFISVA